MKYISNNKTIQEIFDYVVNNSKNNQEKLALLKQFNHRGIKWLVHVMYCRDLSQYPIPKYEPNTRDKDLCHATIFNSINRIEAALRVYETKPKRYNDLMTLVLQELPQDDAQLLSEVMSGKKYQKISKSIWKQIYPEFFRLEQ